MSDTAKFKYSAQEGVLELEGSEEFVSKHFGLRGQAQLARDFLQTKLEFKGGNYNQFIPLAKKLGPGNGKGPDSINVHD